MFLRLLIIVSTIFAFPALASAQSRETLCPDGYSALSDNDAPQAIEAFDDCLRQQFFEWPAEAELRTRLGAALLAEGRAEEALIASNQILALIEANQGDSNHPLVRRNRAAAFVQLDRYEDALADLAIARERNPADSFSAVLEGTALLHLDRYAEAVAAYDAALRIEPGYGAAWMGRSNAFLELGLMENGVSDAEEALTLSPDDPNAMNALCWALIQAERAQDGLSLCQRASELAPDSGSITHSLAAALEQIGDLDTARSLYARAYEQAPEVDLIAEDYARLFP